MKNEGDLKTKVVGGGQQKGAAATEEGGNGAREPRDRNCCPCSWEAMSTVGVRGLGCLCQAL